MSQYTNEFVHDVIHFLLKLGSAETIPNQLEVTRQCLLRRAKALPGISDNDQHILRQAKLETCGILDLPEEVILHLLKYVPENERFWNFGFTSEALLVLSLKAVTIIDIGEDRQLNSAKRLRLKQILQTDEIAKSIKHLIICSDYRTEFIVNCEGLKELKGKYGNGKVLRLSNFDFAGFGEEPIFDGKLCLESITIENNYRVYCSNVCLTGRTVTDILKKSPDLSVLNIKGQYILNDSEISIATSYCKELVTLRLNECLYLTDSGLDIVVKNCPNLRCLEIHECNRLTFEGIRTLTDHCKNLVHLSLNDCINVNPSGISYVTKHCQLQHLCLSRYIHLTDIAMQDISANFTNLVTLELGWCELLTDKGFEYMAVNCKALHKLHLNGCDQISDAGLKSIEENCGKLEELLLSAYEKNQHDYTHGLKSLANNCQSLKMLTLVKIEVSSGILDYLSTHIDEVII